MKAVYHFSQTIEFYSRVKVGNPPLAKVSLTQFSCPLYVLTFAYKGVIGYVYRTHNIN